MVDTGVFATAEETAELKTLAQRVHSMPVIAFSIADGLDGGGEAGRSSTRMQKRCHELALAHGLPEIEGYYGITNDGQFVRD